MRRYGKRGSIDEQRGRLGLLRDQAIAATLVLAGGALLLKEGASLVDGLTVSGLQLDISPQVIAAVIISVVVLLAVAFMIPKVRRAIRPWLAEAAEALRVLRSPTKVFQLFAGNLVAQVILAWVLGMCLRAFGQQASLAELILVNTLASLLAGVLPIPGGIGVMEAAISFGLVAVGIGQSAAVSTAILFRIITFYLPPIWGSYAMRVLRHRGYI